MKSQQMMNDRIKVGIVGIGGYGRVLLEELLARQQRGEMSLAAALVVDPQLDREPLEFLERSFPDTRVFQSWDEMRASGVRLDLMILPVGIPAHCELTVAALDAGWNVLVEKPLAGSPADGLRMAEAAARAGRFVAVGYQDMYGGHVDAMKSAILGGEIGRLRRVKAHARWGRPEAYYRRNNWAGKLSVNGRPVMDSPFNNALAHYLNIALFLAGTEPDEPAAPVSATAALFRGHDIESCDTASIIWQTAGGAEAGVWFTHLGSANVGPEIIAEGHAGCIRWRLEEGWTLCRDGQEEVRHPAVNSHGLRGVMVGKVLERVRSADVRVYTPCQALAQVRAVEMVHAAAEIQDIPAAALTRSITRDENGGESRWVDATQLPDALHDAFNHNRLLAMNDFISTKRINPAHAPV